MSIDRSLFKGAFYLTLISFITRFMGFFYRIFLSRTFGEEGVGLYQLIFPIFSLCLAFSVSGIQTALSRIVAFKSARHDKQGVKNSLYTALLLSCFLSFLTMLLIQQNLDFISTILLNDKRCKSMLLILTYAFPFATIHSCISGYYYGLKQTKIPAISQLIEQIVRVFFVYILYKVMIAKHIHLSISIAVIGLVIGEFSSATCSILSLKSSHTTNLFHVPNLFNTHFFSNFKELASLSVPLSANRIVLNVLQSIETISIPAQLQVYRYTSSEALSMYGVLTGMALPCILFPSAITNSISLLLTPTVAEIDSSSDKERLIKLVKRTIFLSFALGLFCCFGFLIGGNVIGNVLFHSEMAGKFILTLAWICPFLYLNSTLASVIHGLGKTTATFLINIFGISIRIISIYVFIPLFGIEGYLWGLLCSQILVCISTIFFLLSTLDKMDSHTPPRQFQSP